MNSASSPTLASTGAHHFVHCPGNPPKPYVFTPNDMKNTTLFFNGDPIYTIKTDLVSDTRTYVDNSRTGQRIATITRRNLFPDTVTFHDNASSNNSDQHYRGSSSGKPISIHKWLRKHKLPDGYPTHEMRTTIGTWVWKSDAMHRLGLYARGSGGDTDALGSVVAYLQLASATHPLTLFLDSIVEPILDDILVACLILEQRMRIAERNINVANWKFEQNKMVLGYYVHT